MKVVFYKGQMKFTVDNVIIPNVEKFQELLTTVDPSDVLIDENQLQDFRITSTRGMATDIDFFDDEEIAREIEEGIYCRQETVN